MGLTKFEALQILGLEEGGYGGSWPFRFQLINDLATVGRPFVPTGCTEKEIRDRFKKLALKWHPDKNFQNPDEAQKVIA